MINEALMEVQKRLNAPKTQHNSFGNYDYRSCEDILKAVKPLLIENHLLLTLSDEIISVGDRVYIQATAKLSLEYETNNGDTKHEWVHVTAYAREEEEKKGMDASQITGAASSYARKYALNGLFCIDDNKDSDYTNTAPKEPTEAKSKSKTDARAESYKCSACGKEIEKNVAEYSYKKLGRLLCRDCQKKA